MKNIISIEFKEIIKSNFKYLWISQIFSQLTVNILNFILIIYLFEKTQSTIATSFLWVSYALPAIFVGPIAAVAIDVYNRRKILIITNSLQAITILSFAILNPDSVFISYGVVIVYSLLNQFYLPSETAVLPSTVKSHQLSFASSMFFLTQQAALVIGFGMAGALRHLLGFNMTLYICFVMLILAAISVYFLPKVNVKETNNENIEELFLSFFKKIFEGYNFIKNNYSVWMPFSLLVFLQILVAVVTVNLPLFAKDLFFIPLNFIGIILIAPTGIGCMIAALYIPKAMKKGIRKKNIIEKGLFLLSLTLISLTLVSLLDNNVVKILFAILLVFVLGFSYVSIFIPSQTFLQEKTPGGFKGRVFGNFWFVTTIATVFPVIFSGTFSEIFGIRLMLFLIGIIIFASGIVTIKFYNSFNHKNNDN